MKAKAAEYETFEALKARLDEIVEAVGDENLPLDDALDLYEEAVALGMRVSELMEEGINVDDDAEGQNLAEAAEADGAAAGDTPEQGAVQASAAH